MTLLYANRRKAFSFEENKVTFFLLFFFFHSFYFYLFIHFHDRLYTSAVYTLLIGAPPSDWQVGCKLLVAAWHLLLSASCLFLSSGNRVKCATVLLFGLEWSAEMRDSAEKVYFLASWDRLSSSNRNYIQNVVASRREFMIVEIAGSL